MSNRILVEVETSGDLKEMVSALQEMQHLGLGIGMAAYCFYAHAFAFR